MVTCTAHVAARASSCGARVQRAASTVATTMACAHEHGCGHGHGHDDADHVKPGEGEQNLLYLAIDRERVSALNEQRAGMAPSIIKPYDERLDETRFRESDVDDELMIHVPFAGSVKLRALLLKTGPEGAARSTASAARPRTPTPGSTSSASAARSARCSARGHRRSSTRLRPAPRTTPRCTAPRPAPTHLAHSLPRCGGGVT